MSAGGDEVYDDFAATYGRRHSTPAEYEHRRQVFHDNRKFIEEWNSQAQSSQSHMLGLNHFADWTQVCVSCSFSSGKAVHAVHAQVRELGQMSSM